MQKTKLIDLFKALKTDELREFAKFLDSPFYVKKAKKERITRLFEYLKKNRSELNTKKLNRDYVFKKIFPKDEVFEDWKIRELRSDLSKLIEEYFIVKEASQNHIDRQMLLIKSFEKRQVDTHFFRYARKMEKELNELELKNIEHYFALLQLQHQLYYHPATSKFDNKGSRQLLMGVIYSTDMFYSLAKLRYGYEIAAWERIRGEKLEGFISEKTIESLDKGTITTNPLLHIYWLFNKLYKSQEYNLYSEIKQLVLDKIEFFSDEEANDVLALLINSLRLVFSGEEIFKEGLVLYKVALKYKIFINGDSFMIEHFNNIVSVGCGAGEYQWTQDFINKYYMYLPAEEDRKENIAILYRANLSFLRQRYEDAESVLYRLEFEDVTYGVRHYILLIKCLYELKRDELDDKYNAFSVYIFRKKRDYYISRDIHEGYDNFIKMVRQIAGVRGIFKISDAQKKELIDRIKNVGIIVEKTWLIEKVNEL